MPTKLFDLGSIQLNSLRDSLGFRDKMYVRTLVQVPTPIPLHQYRDMNIPVLDQKNEGASTGFGLATVANYLKDWFPALIIFLKRITGPVVFDGTGLGQFVKSSKPGAGRINFMAH